MGAKVRISEEKTKFSSSEYKISPKMFVVFEKKLYFCKRIIEKSDNEHVERLLLRLLLLLCSNL